MPWSKATRTSSGEEKGNGFLPLVGIRSPLAKGRSRVR